MNNFLLRTFAQNTTLKYSDKEIDLSTLNYSFSKDDLEVEEILEISKDSIVDSNLDLLSDNIMSYNKKWNYDNSKDQVNEYVKELFNENNKNNIDFDKFTNQLIKDLIRFGYVDFYLSWNQKEKTLPEIKPLNQELYARDLYGIVTYNGNFIIKNEDGKIPQFVSKKYNDDSRNIYGCTTFNREMLNFVRLKKRLIILMDLAADKSSIPPVIGTISKEVQENFDITNIDPAAVNGQTAFFKFLDSLSASLAGLSSGNGIAVAGMDKIEGLKTNISADLFEKFKNIANEALAVGVTGTARTTQQSDKGSFASDQVTNSSVIDPKKKKFAKIAQKSINEIIKYCVIAKFSSFNEVAPFFKFDFSIKPTQEEKLGWYVAGEKIKVEDAPYYIYIEDGQKFIQKKESTALTFAEKKKTLKPKVKF